MQQHVGVAREVVPRLAKASYRFRPNSAFERLEADALARNFQDLQARFFIDFNPMPMEGEGTVRAWSNSAASMGAACVSAAVQNTVSRSGVRRTDSRAIDRAHGRHCDVHRS